MRTNMKLLLLLVFLSSTFLFSTEDTDERKVSELSIDELKQIVRMIVEESIEQCTVTGTMNISKTAKKVKLLQKCLVNLNLRKYEKQKKLF